VLISYCLYICACQSICFLCVINDKRRIIHITCVLFYSLVNQHKHNENTRDSNDDNNNNNNNNTNKQSSSKSTHESVYQYIV